jgi:hypothetical protein
MLNQQLTTETEVETHPMVVRMHPVVNLTDDQFFEFCQINRTYALSALPQENC